MVPGQSWTNCKKHRYGRFLWSQNVSHLGKDRLAVGVASRLPSSEGVGVG